MECADPGGAHKLVQHLAKLKVAQEYGVGGGATCVFVSLIREFAEFEELLRKTESIDCIALITERLLTNAFGLLSNIFE